MAVINIPGKEPWFVARWYFYQLLDRTAGELDDERLVAKLEQAKALDGLQLGMLPQSDGERLALALARAARGLANELETQPQDKLGRSFIEALRDLDRRLGSPP